MVLAHPKRSRAHRRHRASSSPQCARRRGFDSMPFGVRIRCASHHRARAPVAASIAHTRAPHTARVFVVVVERVRDPDASSSSSSSSSSIVVNQSFIMASAGDMLARADALLKKYDAYVPKTRERVETEAKIANLHGTDAFSAMMMNAENVLAELLEKASAVKAEKNRAAVATLNAEVRRGKNYLRGEVPKLRKVAKTKASGVTDDDVRAMLEVVDDLEARVENVSDGVTRALPPQKKPNSSGVGGYGGPSVTVNIDPNVQPGSSSNPFINMQHSETSKAFRMEFEKRKEKQDAGLDAISRGLGVLKDIGGEMTEEMRRQEPITDAIEEKLDSANRDMRTANARLKEAVTKMRSTRKFCIDIILIVVVLGIALTLYKTLT